MIPSNWGSVNNNANEEKRSDDEVFGRSLNDIKSGLRGKGDNLVRPDSPSVASFLTRAAAEIETSVKENRPDDSNLDIIQVLYHAIENSDHPELIRLKSKLEAYMGCPRETGDLLTLELNADAGEISIKF